MGSVCHASMSRGGLNNCSFSIFLWTIVDLVEIQLALEHGTHLLLIIIYVRACKKLLPSKMISNLNGLHGCINSSGTLKARVLLFLCI